MSCGCEAPGPSATVGPHATRSTQRRRRDHDVKAPAMTRQPDGLVKRVPVKARERSSKTSRPGSARTAPSSKPMPGISRSSPASRSSTTTPSSSPPSSVTETSSRTSLTSSPTPRLQIQASPVEQRCGMGPAVAYAQLMRAADPVSKQASLPADTAPGDIGQLAPGRRFLR